jgi:hypothetical protein
MTNGLMDKWISGLMESPIGACWGFSVQQSIYPAIHSSVFCDADF